MKKLSSTVEMCVFGNGDELRLSVTPYMKKGQMGVELIDTSCGETTFNYTVVDIDSFKAVLKDMETLSGLMRNLRK